MLLVGVNDDGLRRLRDEANRFKQGYAALEEENAKLRELARLMWKPFCWAQSGYEVCLTDEQEAEIRDMARELGIEEDE